MTNYNKFKETIEVKKALKNSTSRFAGTMLLGIMLTATFLVLHGWTILDIDIPWLNHAFSFLMVFCGGIAAYTIDQAVLSLQIANLDRKMKHSIGDFKREIRREEKAYLKANRGKVVEMKPALQVGYELQDISKICQDNSFKYERVDRYIQRR